MNNKRLYDRLNKIKLKENDYIKPIEKNFYEKNKKVYDYIQRQIVQTKISKENNRLNEKINKA